MEIKCYKGYTPTLTYGYQVNLKSKECILAKGDWKYADNGLNLVLNFKMYTNDLFLWDNCLKWKINDTYTIVRDGSREYHKLPCINEQKTEWIL